MVKEGTGKESAVRPVSVRQMPLWRKSEIILGILRSALRGHVKSGQIPILHRFIRLRRSNGTIRFGKFTEIHDRCVISAVSAESSNPAKVSIGGYTSIWYGTVISAKHEVTIGSHCAISWNCSILDNDMHELLLLEEAGRTKGNFVRIADHVWIGTGSTILKGVTIGTNSVVAAGSIVTRDVPPNTLVAGAPAKVVREIAGWR